MSHLIQQPHIILIIQSQIQCTWTNAAHVSNTQPMLAGALADGRAAVKWATDYFLKAHTAPNEFYGQVGQGDVDHAYWGRPEDMTMPRPAYKIDTSRPGKPASCSFFPIFNLRYPQEIQRSMQNVLVILTSDTFTSNTVHRRCDSTLFIFNVFILRHCIH